MYLNNFSVRITNGREVENGYVEMQHNTQYAIVMRNDHDRACDARVVIDGKDMGTFRIYAHSSITLERKPGDDKGKFTFYKEGTGEAKQAAIEAGNSNNGLIAVTFTPEKKQPVVIHHYHYHDWDWYPPRPWPTPTWTYNSGEPYQIMYTGNSGNLQSSAGSVQSRSAGGTGLSGHSDQNFMNVGSLDLDYSAQTTINLRLIATEQSDVRPLSGASNPIPLYIR